LIYRKEGEDQKTKKQEEAKSLPKKKPTVEEDAVEYLKKLNNGRKVD